MRTVAMVIALGATLGACALDTWHIRFVNESDRDEVVYLSVVGPQVIPARSSTYADGVGPIGPKTIYLLTDDCKIRQQLKAGLPAAVVTVGADGIATVAPDGPLEPGLPEAGPGGLSRCAVPAEG